MSCALSCLMPGCPGLWVGCKAGFAKGILQRGCRELWGSGSAESHNLTAWLGSLQHRCLPVEVLGLGLWGLHFAWAQSTAI